MRALEGGRRGSGSFLFCFSFDFAFLVTYSLGCVV